MAIEQIIKYEGSNNVFIWKHPIEDFNIGTQLIVHETQEAVFFINGQAVALFGAGRHTLETENIPFLKNIINLNTGGQTPFHAEVYFINKTEQMGIKWGTDSKVTYMEPNYNFPLSLGACGELSLRVDNSRKLLLKIVGTENGLSQDGLIKNLKSFLMMHIKSLLAKVIMENKINIFTIDSELPILSEKLKEQIAPCFEDYGVVLERFIVTTVLRPEGEEVYEKFKNIYFRQYSEVAEAQIAQNVGIIQQQTEAKKLVIEAEAIAKKRSVEGYTYQQERGFDVAEKVAENESVGEFSNLGIGMGMISGVGNSLGGYVGNITNQSLNTVVVNTSDRFCSNCGTKISSGSRFCSNCGNNVEEENTSNICSKCGYTFLANEKFCPKCGNKR